MAGNFNMTEDQIDRGNGMRDQTETINVLADLKNTLNLVDGWRQMFPTENGYMLQHQSNEHRSRLDRIYLTPELLEITEEWNIKYPPHHQ
jgi:hypothetical protein